MPHSALRRPTRRGLLAAGAALVLVGSMPLSAGAASPQNGFKTEHPAMLLPGAGAPFGTEIKPLITVGDMIGSYRYESIPDGISFWQSGKNEATVLVNHETSTVPFPYNGAAPTATNSFNDFDNSQLSELVIRRGGQILSAEMVIDTGDGYHRFCSNFLATTDGFEDRPLLFTNEEGIDWVYEDVNAAGLGWTTGVNLEGADGAREIGAVVAYDPASGAHRPIWGMGRHNHENSVAIPVGFPFLLSGDDSFNQNAPQSQLYAYAADDANAVWEDEGTLYAFAPAPGSATVNDYYDFAPGTSMSISGRFIPVPKDIATGKDGDGDDMLSSDVGYPAPPTDGTWQRPPGVVVPAGGNPADYPSIDGPQWILEHWGDLPENNVFQFLRIEDIAYDKRPGMGNVVYLADSGRGSGAAPNGRIWKMVLNPNDPFEVTELSILIDGDDSPSKTVGEIHQPDNLETTVNGLYVTEDPSSGNTFTPQQQIDDAARATTARVWQYSFADEELRVVLKVDQAADEGPTDVDLGGLSRWGDWEASGIIDVSSVFGPGKFLVNVQAHTLYVAIDTTSAPDNLAPAGADWQFKREGGQLLLVTIPGG